MAFGKKNKKKVKDEQPGQAAKKVKVDMRHNPLYPPKKESDARELLTAFGTTAVSLVLVGVIVMNFSYANRASANGNKYAGRQPSTLKQEETYGGAVNVENANNGDGNNEETYGPKGQDGQAAESVENGGAFNGAEEAATDNAHGEERDYIIDDSDSRYLYVEDLEGLSAEELFYARNEIYARCGRLFNDEGLQSYFNSKEWYHGIILPEEFTEDMLNEFERVNAVFIRDYEVEHGYQ